MKQVQLHNDLLGRVHTDDKIDFDFVASRGDKLDRIGDIVMTENKRENGHQRKQEMNKKCCLKI